MSGTLVPSRPRPGPEGAVEPRRQRRRWLRLLAGAIPALLAGMALGPACRRRPTLDQQARALLARLEQAAEEGDVDEIRELVSPSFRGPDDLDRGAALLLLRARLRERPSIHILSRLVSLEVEGPVARAELVAAMAALPIGGPSDLARLQADVYRWKLELAAEGGELQVTSASWEPAQVFDFQ